MFYPTGNSTNGRKLICIDDERKKLDECLGECKCKDSEGSCTCDESNCGECKCNESCNCVENWLGENNYCVERWQLKNYLTDRGLSTNKLVEDNGGGGAPAAGLATLGNVGGMGNPAPPTNGGTNSGFYDTTKSGSGDIFNTMSAGTNAAKKRAKGKKKMISYKEFIEKNRKKKK